MRSAIEICLSLWRSANAVTAGQTAEVDACLGMPGTHQHAAVLPNQRKDVTRAHEIRRASIAIGQRAYGVGPLLRRNSGSESVTHVDRNRESGAERRVICRDHGV